MHELVREDQLRADSETVIFTGEFHEVLELFYDLQNEESIYSGRMVPIYYYRKVD